MGKNTINREIKMDTINSDLDLLENLSKKISDLIYDNKFNQISEIDAQRKALIKKITREIIVVKSVEAKILEKKIGYIRLKSFNSNSSNQLIKKIDDFEKKNNPIKEKRCLFPFLRNAERIAITKSSLLVAIIF